MEVCFKDMANDLIFEYLFIYNFSIGRYNKRSSAMKLNLYQIHTKRIIGEIKHIQSRKAKGIPRPSINSTSREKREAPVIQNTYQLLYNYYIVTKTLHTQKCVSNIEMSSSSRMTFKVTIFSKVVCEIRFVYQRRQ